MHKLKFIFFIFSLVIMASQKVEAMQDSKDEQSFFTILTRKKNIKEDFLKENKSTLKKEKKKGKKDKDTSQIDPIKKINHTQEKTLSKKERIPFQKKNYKKTNHKEKNLNGTDSTATRLFSTLDSKDYLEDFEKFENKPDGVFKYSSDKKLNSNNENILENEDNEANSRAHFFNLKKNDAECHTFLDSRGMCENAEVYGVNFKSWHERSIKALKKLTPKVRKSLNYLGKDSNTNLLKHKVSIISMDKEEPSEIEIEEGVGVWISGWPGKNNREKLKSKEFSEVEFLFFDDFLSSEQKDLSANNKHPLLLNSILDGYCCEKHGYLIKERHQYLSKSSERAKKDLQHFNYHFLHTEQALLKYLASDSFQKKVLQEIEENSPMEKAVMIVNIASSRSVCLHCADRIFHESEWGNGFLHNIREKSGVDLKIHFFASAFEKYPDELKKTNDSKPLRDRLKKEKKSQRKIGFDGDGKINFMGSRDGRQPFSVEYPLIAHAFIEKD